MMKQLLVARFIKGNDRKEAAERKGEYATLDELMNA